MDDKKEFQDSLIKATNSKASDEEFLFILKMVAPGTNFRTALDGTLSAGKGALIVVENDYLLPIIDGGFRINCKFTPQKLIELTKMDGAIILSRDMKKIDYANVLLTPDSRIKTSETGTRHKAAERTAKQIKTLAVAVSERRGQITLYYKNVRYPLRESNDLLRKASEHVQLLEKQRELFDNYVIRLNKAELQSYLNPILAITVIQKGMLIQRIAEELKKYIVELGKEGTLLKIRLKEIKGGVEKEKDLVIKDYTNFDLKKTSIFLDNLSYEEILDDQNIANALGYEEAHKTEPIQGWRLLSKTSLPEPEAALIISYIGNLKTILNVNDSTFSGVIGEERGKKFADELNKLKINA